MKALISGIGLLFAASLSVAQDQRDSAANRSKIIAFENAWNARISHCMAVLSNAHYPCRKP
jgi:hypothetical protein